MKNLYIRILFVLALSWHYSDAQTPVANWPLWNYDALPGGQVRDASHSLTATLYSTSNHQPVGSGPTFSYVPPNTLGNDRKLALANDQYLQMTNFFGAFPSSPFTVPGKLTIAFWMIHNPGDNSRRSIFSGGDGLGLDIENNTLILKRKETQRDAYSEFPIVESKQIFLQSGSPTWYFIAVAYEEHFLRVYTIQKRVANVSCSYQWFGSFEQKWNDISPTTGFVLGSNKAGINSVAGLGDFRVFDRTLTMEEINNLATNEAYAGFYDFKVTKNGVGQPGGIVSDAKVGDVIQFAIKTNSSSTPPLIENLPQTWIARFSGDLRYFVDASFTPGLSKPWIGFDTQVHWLNLRNYEQEPGRVNYPQWTTVYSAGAYIHTLDYVVSAPMRYHQPRRGKFKWDKFSHNKVNGVYDKHMVLSNDKKVWTQRANQKEGLNMQILHYWNWDASGNWVIPDYTTTYAGAPYMMGFDDDEILYSGSRHHDRPNEGRHAILREPMSWQTVPVQETASEDETVNAMVSAYYQAKGEYPKGKAFLGSEVMDYYTEEVTPEGTGTWMHEDGNIKLTFPAAGIVFRAGINAESPLKRFYAINGPNVVGREEEVDFTLHGFDETVNLKAVIDNYVTMGYEVTLEYETQDSFGTTKHGGTIPPTGSGPWTSPSGLRTGVATHQVYSTTDANSINKRGPNPFSTMVDNTDLVFRIKTIGDSYCSVSLYLNKTDVDPTKSVRVLLAGKDVIPVNLAFLEDQNLVKGTGEGGYFFIEQQRNVKILANDHQMNGPFNVPRGDKYVNPFVRTYTFYQGQSSNWKVWDSDPHMFAGDGTTPEHDWYQSNKKQAFRVTDQQIASEHLVQYYFDNIADNDADGDGYLKMTEVGSPVSGTTRFFNIDYSTKPPGVYQLTATFRGQQPIRHKIIIKTARIIPSAPLASVKVTDLSPYDKELLNTQIDEGYELPANVNYKVLEIQELSSQLMYLVGERNNYKKNLGDIPNVQTPALTKFSKINRWGPFNDYHSQFFWFSNSGLIITPAAFTFIDAAHGWTFIAENEKTFEDRSQSTTDPDQFGYQVPHFPYIWGNHFSSLWKEEGPGPLGLAGPSYLPTANLLYENDPDLKTDFDNYFTYDVINNYWQKMATLNSWSDSYGYRMRYNPSHVYSIPRIYGTTHGAFSGAAISSQFSDTFKSRTRQPYPSDNFMNLQAWYYDLTSGRKLIISEGDYNIIKDQIKIYNDYDTEYTMLLDENAYKSTNMIDYATVTIDGSPRRTIPLCLNCSLTEVTGGGSGRLAATTETKSEATRIDSEFKPDVTVYPNTVDTHERVNVEVTSTKLSPMYVAVYDLTGRVIFEESSFVDRGVNQFTLDASNLGVYTEMIVVKIVTDELNETRKIIVTTSVDKK